MIGGLPLVRDVARGVLRPPAPSVLADAAPAAVRLVDAQERLVQVRRWRAVALLGGVVAGALLARRVLS